MTAAFLLCLRQNTSGDADILLGQKHDGKVADRGLTVPAGRMKKRDHNLLINTAIRELKEETGITVQPKQLKEFRINGGDYWFLAQLSDETPRSEPEVNRIGEPMWGPAKFYPLAELPKLPIARWQKKQLKKALAAIPV